MSDTPQTVFTIGRHLVEEEKNSPKASGKFTGLLWDLTTAFKIISSEVNKAGLVDILGLTGKVNVHGERVQKLDEFADDIIFRAMDHGGNLCVMASEEQDDIIPIPAEFKKGKYVLLFDPLDGSSNIDVNVSIGSIFSILERVSASGDGTLEDCLQPGYRQIGAGYAIYGSSTMLVYSTGNGVNGFTLDPSIGEFLLSHPDIQIPERGSIYSINEGHSATWDDGTRRYVEHLKSGPDGRKPYSGRYIGSLVSDFHRNLLKGGIFIYPASYADPENPEPKLRLLYEASPMGFLVEQAGGLASTGAERTLRIDPTELHQRVPVVLGSRQDVEDYEAFFQQRR